MLDGSETADGTEGAAGMDDRGLLPGGYDLDETGTDVAVLRRGDGSFVAAFSAAGAPWASIQRTAEEDRAREARPAERVTA